MGCSILCQSEQLVGCTFGCDAFITLTGQPRSFRAIKNMVIDTTRVPPHVVSVIMVITG